MFAKKSEETSLVTKRKTSKFNKALPFLILITICFVMGMLTMLLVYSVHTYTWEQAADIAFKDITQNSGIFNNAEKTCMNSIEKLSNQLALPSVNSEEVVSDKIATLYDGTCFDYLRFSKDNKDIYNANNAVSAAAGNEELSSLISTQSKGMTDVFTDSEMNQEVYAFYCPVNNNTNISGVIGYITKENFFAMTGFSDYNSGTNTCIITTDGKMVYGQLDTYHTGENVFSVLLADGAKEKDIQTITDKVDNKASGYAKLQVNNNDVIICFAPLDGNMGWSMVSMYPQASIMSDNGNLLGMIYGIGIALIIVFVAVYLYLWFLRSRFDTQISTVEHTDPVTGNINYDTFLTEAERILETNKRINYAVLYIDIMNFEYLTDNYGYQTSTDCISFLAKIISKSMDKEESFARMSADRFAVLWRYENIDDLITRYKLLYLYMYNYEDLASQGYHLKVNAGIYCVAKDKKYSIIEMIDRAQIAHKSNTETGKENYVFYDENLRVNFLRKAVIESEMEKSLENGEFKLYLQPKYNIEKNRIDSAEALVRWQHPKRGLVSPGEFVPIFESNGFIREVDKYIYIETCKMINRLVGQHKRMVPISVNVSRVSVANPKFLKTYMDIKNKYQIGNEYLELEFTESFALESYETLSKIIVNLRNNGFACSIDDFGSGYSSFNALKELQMDVLKLDKFFLNPGSNKERDELLISGVINLGKSLGMKTVMEGVEKPEELKMLKRLGCDVIQGYLYAKPMPVADFEKFLETGFDGLPQSVLHEYYNVDTTNLHKKQNANV